MTCMICITPIGPDRGEDTATCGRPATTTRTIHGLEVPLCDEHARELDEDPAEPEEMN